MIMATEPAQLSVTKTRPEHDGPCRVDLDIGIAGTGLSPRHLAERAFIWADGLDEFVGVLALAQEALASGRGMVEMDREHFDALVEVVAEFGNYAAMCGYDQDEDDEDRAIAQALIREDGRIITWLFCECAVTWTETIPPRSRWGEPTTVTRRALAHV